LYDELCIAQANGPPGATGLSGATGVPGSKGYPGSQGPPGSIGAVGATGGTGSTGPVGFTGPIGRPIIVTVQYSNASRISLIRTSITGCQLHSVNFV
jgi:hypothetical protein